tara:strand:+ start:1032 stop:1976 length:945 start_codon:yes stop_codon:yes gene_type:complete
MIELATKYKKDWTMFTLASLKDQKGFRLHLFINKEDWNVQEVDWILANFTNVKIYESWWNSNNISRMVFHLKHYYKDIGMAKRLVVWDGNRIFNHNIDTGDIPPAEFFKASLSFLARDLVFDKHPNIGHYYDVLKIKRRSHQDMPIIDKNIVFLNYDRLAEFEDRDLFFTRQIDPPNQGKRPYIDTKLIACNDLAFFEALTHFKHSWQPLYVNGKLDRLIQLDALGPKEMLDYNIMLRKSLSIDIEHQYLARDYGNLNTGVQLSVPWDCYTKLIDKIPVNFRNSRLNELLLIKAAKQKAMAGKLLKAGFHLGKV